MPESVIMPSCLEGSNEYSLVNENNNNNNGIKFDYIKSIPLNNNNNNDHNSFMKSFKPVTHVIFDLDGLLIDSEQRFANAITILLKRFGKCEINY